MAILLPFHGKRPRVAESAFIAPNAVLIGDVTVEENASVWFGAVVRGDDAENGIVVGAGSSVQDNCVVHVGDWAPTIIGRRISGPPSRCWLREVSTAGSCSRWSVHSKSSRRLSMT